MEGPVKCHVAQRPTAALRQGRSSQDRENCFFPQFLTSEKKGKRWRSLRSDRKKMPLQKDSTSITLQLKGAR